MVAASARSFSEPITAVPVSEAASIVTSAVPLNTMHRP
jgi:hypothetical protein